MFRKIAQSFDLQWMFPTFSSVYMSSFVPSRIFNVRILGGNFLKISAIFEKFLEILVNFQAKMHVIYAFGKVEDVRMKTLKILLAQLHFQRQLDQLGPFRQHFAFCKLCVS